MGMPFLFIIQIKIAGETARLLWKKSLQLKKLISVRKN